MKKLFVLLGIFSLCFAQENPVTLSAYYATDIGGNPVGGLKQGAAYSGFLDVGLSFDLEAIAGLKGMTLRWTNFWASGYNLSDTIGNFYAVQEVFASGNYFFGIVDLSVALFDDKVVYEVGRLLAGDVFIRNNLWQYYLTSGLNGNMQSAEANIVFPAYNIAAWGTRLTYEPNQHWQFIAALYNNNSGVQTPDNHGLYLALNPDRGTLAIGQMTYGHHQTPSAYCLPGSIIAGGYYNTQPHSSYGIYVIADQMLFRGFWPEFKGPSHLRADARYAEQARMPYHRKHIVAQDRPVGLTCWGALYAAPMRPQNIQLYQFSWGLLYQGLVCSRPYDMAAFCMLRGKFTDDLPGQEAETILELNYRFQKSPTFYITPDLQYVIKPNGRADIPNALVLGIEICINF